MSHSVSVQNRRGTGWIVFGILMGLLIMVAVVYNAIRFFLDQNNYNKGHQAYLQADCTVAIQHFDSVIEGWRMVDMGGYPGLARQEKAECIPFRAAVDRQQAGDFSGALMAYMNFISEYANSALTEAARSRGSSLFVQARPSELADEQSCGSIDSLRGANLIPQQEVNLPPFYLSCGQFYDSASNQQGSFQMYKNLLTEYPGDLLAETAAASLLTNPLACKESEALKNSVIAARNEFMPSLYYQCGQSYDSSGNEQSSFEMYQKLLTEYPGASLAENAAASLLANPLACKESDTLKNSVIAERNEFMPSLYYQCGQTYEGESNWDQAISMYEKFLAAYPTHARAADAEAGLARAIVSQSQATSAGDIPTPERSGSTGSTVSEVVIQNDSPERLRIVFSGPEARVEELEPCSSCTTYTGIGPLYCPEQGPIGRYPLTPGEYDVVVEAISGDGTTPWTGNWSLVTGDEYYNCFFIITTFGP
ncbi:MAG TPA: tetratricopeptide repeat protein [Anaerolineales bacterium]|nr:tetratricopeptide repeat protein [Anaerolineales bacterium]